MTFEEIKELVQLLDESSLASIVVKQNETTVKINKYANNGGIATVAPAAPIAHAVAPAAAPASALHVEVPAAAAGDVITSPMVGTYYQAPSPDSPVYVKVGDKVSKGQTLAIIEAMKIMNELEAEYDCKILEVLVKDGQVIEYDTPLFRVEKL